MPGEGDDTGVADTLSSEQGGASKPTADDSPGSAIRRSGPRAVRAGDVLGRYELIEDIGEGGMASVYRARDRELRRDVAVKVLFPHLARRPEIVRRFHREARAAAGLQHPNIMRIHDVGGGEADDPPFIVMELIRGTTLLGEIEQRGAVLAEIVACIGALLADALVAAHAAGIIHRDIKPANVLVANDGRLLLADFGVARLETEDSLVTKTGALLGTPAYMSPEQATGDTATTRSDLYSVGATLYQLATGVLPYAGSPAKVLAQIASGGLVAPIRKRSSVGPDLSQLIERLMATDPLGRPETAAAVATELRALATAGGMTDAAAELTAYFGNPEEYLRTRTPGVVKALVAAAQCAIAESKLPRAMALADRASALAPDDPTVTALITTVTEGGRTSRRRRILALAGAGIVVAGGAVAGGATLGVFGAAPSPDAAIVSVAIPTAPVDASPDGLVVDSAAILASTQLDGAVDAGRRADAGAARGDARLALDAPVAIDAAILIDAAPPAIDAGDAPSAIIVLNDTWCDVQIDDIGHGRRRDQPLKVTPGHHVVTCAQPSTGKRWSQPVDVAPGETRTVRGQMMAILEVTIGITSGDEVTIGPMHYKRGAVAKVKAGRYEVTVPGVDKKYLTLGQNCTIRDQPQLDCYP